MWSFPFLEHSVIILAHFDRFLEDLMGDWSEPAMVFALTIMIKEQT